MRLLIVLFVLLGFNRCDNFRKSKQDLEAKESYRIISYNVENLFDTWDEEYKFDDDFTPYGSYYWGKEKYEKKIADIGKVLINASGDKVPAIIGLMEIENEVVLEDLLTKSPLSKFQYAIVHEDSPDERGIDVALLYDTKQFQYLDYEIGRVEFPKPIEDRTRDILLVKGILNQDTIYVAVNHWPSRRGGESVSAPKRFFVAKLLKQKVREISKAQPNAGIIIMGDFNDTPTDKSITTYLGALEYNQADTLVNLMTPFAKKGLGTYKYQNQWNLLDQFIVSKNLFDEHGSLYLTNESAHIFAPEWLREGDPVYPGDRVYRTFLGPRYIGGYSDHFPIVLDIYSRN